MRAVSFALALLLIPIKSMAIMNGSDVNRYDPLAKHVVLLELVSPKGLRGYCSGVLIRQDVVLTAAHCTPDNWEIFVLVATSPTIAKNFTSKIRVGERRVDEHFEPPINNSIKNTAIGHDIALLHLETSAPETYSPGRILEDLSWIGSLDHSSWRQLQDRTVTLGFGMNSESAPNSFGILRRGTGVIENAYDDNRILEIRGMFDRNMPWGTCGGDSGGPTFENFNDGDWRVVALTSSGFGLCDTKGYFVNVATHADWIKINVRKWARH